MHWLDVNGAALRYELLGAGDRTLVLVHEMGGTLDSWDHVLPALSRGRRMLRYDTRGAGQSEKLQAPPALDDMADDIAALLDALGISGPVVLMGCAVGGAIVLRFALRHPERTAAIIVTSPATGMPRDRREATLARVATLEAGTMRDAVEASFAASYPPEVRHDAEHYRAFRARWLANDPRSYGAIYRMLAQTDMTDELPRIACPTLVIAGTHDKLRPPAMVEQVAEAIPGAAFRVLDSGHFMAVQTPALVAEAVNGFLAKLGL
jgi:3-oxoadipate enol-lactonase